MDTDSVGFLPRDEESQLAAGQQRRKFTPEFRSDASGIASSCTQPVTSSVGSKTVDWTATDTATATAAYQVQYGFSGFATPVDAAPTVNTAKASQTVPLTWTLTDASGAPVTP